MSRRTNCLLPGLHAWLLGPLLSCGRPLIWVHQLQLWEPPVCTRTEPKGRKRWQQLVSAGKLARTVSLRLPFVQSQAPHLPKLPSQVPCNLLRAHAGSMTGLTTECCWLVLGMVDICFRHQCFLWSPQLYFNSCPNAPLTSLTLTFVLQEQFPVWSEGLRRASTVQKRATASPLLFRSANHIYSFLPGQQPWQIFLHFLSILPLQNNKTPLSSTTFQEKSCVIIIQWKQEGQSWD